MKEDSCRMWNGMLGNQLSSWLYDDSCWIIR